MRTSAERLARGAAGDGTRSKRSNVAVSSSSAKDAQVRPRVIALNRRSAASIARRVERRKADQPSAEHSSVRCGTPVSARWGERERAHISLFQAGSVAQAWPEKVRRLTFWGARRGLNCWGVPTFQSRRRGLKKSHVRQIGLSRKAWPKSAGRPAYSIAQKAWPGNATHAAFCKLTDVRHFRRAQRHNKAAGDACGGRVKVNDHHAALSAPASQRAEGVAACCAPPLRCG